MGSIVIAMPKLADARKIGDLLRGHGITPDAICTTGAEALQEMTGRDYGILICTSKLPDMGYLDISEYMPGCFKMLLMTKDPSPEYRMGHIEKIMLPFRVGELIEAVEHLLEEVDRVVRRKKPSPPKRTAEEKEILDRAKQVLMEKNGMTEPESYRYIQKCSMDSGTKLVEAAEMILLLNES